MRSHDLPIPVSHITYYLIRNSPSHILIFLQLFVLCVYRISLNVVRNTYSINMTPIRYWTKQAFSLIHTRPYLLLLWKRKGNTKLLLDYSRCAALLKSLKPTWYLVCLILRTENTHLIYVRYKLLSSGLL